MNHSLRKFPRTLRLALFAAIAQAPLVGAYAGVIVPEAHNGSTVWTGSDSSNFDATQIGAIVGESGLVSFYDAGFGRAQIATNGGGDAAALDRQVVFTAVQGGIAGHDISVRLVDAGNPNSPLSVAVTGREITVTLATNSAGVPTSTAAQVASAINASVAAGSLVVASAGGSGTGVVESLAATQLAPVIVEAGSFASSYGTLFSNSASFPEDANLSWTGGESIDASSLYLYVRDTAQVPAYYIYDLLAPAISWNGIESLLLDGFWPGAGAIEQVKIVGIASRPTPVPEPSTLALLALGLGALAWRRKALNS